MPISLPGKLNPKPPQTPVQISLPGKLNPKPPPPVQISLPGKLNPSRVQISLPGKLAVVRKTRTTDGKTEAYGPFEVPRGARGRDRSQEAQGT